MPRTNTSVPFPLVDLKNLRASFMNSSSYLLWQFAATCLHIWHLYFNFARALSCLFL
uniref:Uncharacterized protein n=1 Tax=Arundo donax TaxID=35708 RepID=A0A0A9AAV0_ARUDO